MTRNVTGRGPTIMEDPPFARWLFGSTASAWLWLVLRVWLGYQWLEAALHKITDPAWMVTGLAVKGFWERAVAVPPPPARPPGWLRYAVWGGAALLVLLSLIVALRLGGRRARLESSRLAQELEALQQRLAQERAAAEARKQQAFQAAQEELQSQVANLARQRPEEVAQIIRSWLSEE